MGQVLEVSKFEEIFLNYTPILDVRAPVEYDAGSLPHSFNIPILNDKEREFIGTAYKQKGAPAAIDLGHNLVSGSLKAERIKSWIEFAKKNPNGILTCFRGGMRSSLAQDWIEEAGVKLPRLEGGYKSARQFLLQKILEFSAQEKIIVICGYTGSGKTAWLRKNKKDKKILDLEGIANHRGSVFGGLGVQPNQINFENQLALEMLRLMKSSLPGPVYVENESRMVGQCILPESLFELIKASPVLVLERSLEERVEALFEEYVADTEIGKGTQEEGLAKLKSYEDAVLKINKKLGGARTQEILADLALCSLKLKIGRSVREESLIWIKKLLLWYYDPLYAKSTSIKAQSENI